VSPAEFALFCWLRLHPKEAATYGIEDCDGETALCPHLRASHSHLAVSNLSSPRSIVSMNYVRLARLLPAAQAPYPLLVDERRPSPRTQRTLTLLSCALCASLLGRCERGGRAERLLAPPARAGSTLRAARHLGMSRACRCLSAAARRPRVAGSFGVPPADVLWSRFRGVGQGRQCPRPARGAARRGLWVTPERVESPPTTTTAADLRRSTTIDAARSRRRPTGRRYLRPPSPADADDVARRPPPPRSSL